MPKLNADILYLIFKELHYDKRTLYSCLLVNKIWCETTISILWNDPWKYLFGRNYAKGLDFILKESLLLDLIISHLSDEKINNIMSQGIFFTSYNLYKKPLLFNYINFCKHLNLKAIDELVSDSGMRIIYDDLIHLFINENATFTHLYIHENFDYQIQLIPGAEHCITKVDFLSCHTNITDNVLYGLIKICKSIKKLELIINEKDNNYRIAELIENQKSLFNVRYLIGSVLELGCAIYHNREKWYYLENLSLPHLQVLKDDNVCPVKYLANMIEDTSGYLIKITLNGLDYDDFNNKRIIQAIYTKCPNLEFLKIGIKNNNILELENLLINCGYLNGLFIPEDSNKDGRYWDDSEIEFFDILSLFEVLARSSPANLFKFKFRFKVIDAIQMEFLELFFDNWKGRAPMLLQIAEFYIGQNDLVEKYKPEGIIEKFDDDLYGEDFEWD
ncbi:hypothetical protein RclHR1_03950012 [Rhizophagus clarus]|uniref:F-box domain-containing protein n=1 Tax=Rhizophagus clarus TaxID=94130 RepID=A0A2Z6RDP2_9GLOM|nr:hypothetical protein RclHR1_03950012 [Rhizophagus clarus]GES92867.1 hypothetical protein GLOIN_2v1867142 [Rhizophagus clarus]